MHCDIIGRKDLDTARCDNIQHVEEDTSFNETLWTVDGQPVGGSALALDWVASPLPGHRASKRFMIEAVVDDANQGLPPERDDPPQHLNRVPITVTQKR